MCHNTHRYQGLESGKWPRRFSWLREMQACCDQGRGQGAKKETKSLQHPRGARSPSDHTHHPSARTEPGPPTGRDWAVTATASDWSLDDCSHRIACQTTMSVYPARLSSPRRCSEDERASETAARASTRAGTATRLRLFACAPSSSLFAFFPRNGTQTAT